MNKIILCLCAFFGGCDKTVTDDQILSSMVSPVILIGKNNNSAYYNDCIATVLDSTGEIRSFHGSATAIALSSRNVGDTIK